MAKNGMGRISDGTVAAKMPASAVSAQVKPATSDRNTMPCVFVSQENCLSVSGWVIRLNPAILSAQSCLSYSNIFSEMCLT